MNKFQNIIITSSPYIIMGCNFSNDLVEENEIKNVSCTKFSKLPCLENEIYADTVNYIYIINKYLNKIKEEIKNNKNISCRFFINQRIYSIITKGTFKYWILNGKTESSGKEIPEIELEMWREFSNLYSEIFANVTFTSLNFIMSKNIKYNQKNILFTQAIVGLMEDKIKEINEIKISDFIKNN